MSYEAPDDEVAAPEEAVTDTDTPETDTTATEAPAATGAVVDRSRYEYTVHNDAKTASGRASVDNNDTVASLLRGMTVAGVRKVLEANGGKWNDAWNNLNPGLARMSAGNVIRRIGKDKEIVIPDEARATIPVIVPKPSKAKKPAPAPAPKPEKAEKPAPAPKPKKAPKAPKQTKAEMQAGLASKVAKTDEAA